MEHDERYEKLYRLFFNYQIERGARLTSAGTEGNDNGSRQALAYYTTAETAMKVFSSRSIYLRNATVMNDYSEMSYGYRVVSEALGGVIGKKLDDLLNQIDPTLVHYIRDNHKQLSHKLREDIFTASLSEQDTRAFFDHSGS